MSMLDKLSASVCLDESLRYLIPHAPLASWYEEATFDENGLLHSYDNVPIMVKTDHRFNNEAGEALSLSQESALRGYVEFHWYSHGVTSRSDNLPPVVTITENMYLTWDGHRQLQSYNDMPSKIEIIDSAKEVRFSWHNENLLSRDNGLPAIITYGLNGSVKNESFYLNEVPHRSNSLPSQMAGKNKLWKVQGVIHNATGAAEHVDTAQEHIAHGWFLYGLEVPETVFNSIRQLTTNTGIPLYAAFLVNVGITTLEHLNTFMDDTGAWKTDVPVVWVLRALNVTPEIFGDKVRKAKVSYPMLSFGGKMGSDEKEFKNFMKVIASEEADATATSSLRKNA